MPPNKRLYNFDILLAVNFEVFSGSDLTINNWATHMKADCYLDKNFSTCKLPLGFQEQACSMWNLILPICNQVVSVEIADQNSHEICQELTDLNCHFARKLIESLTLTLSQTTSFRLFQTERVCRRQFQM